MAEAEESDIKAMHYVLVAEDDVDLRAAVVLMLQAVGYNTVGCANGLEVVKVLVEPSRISKPGLMLLDLEMPILNGWEVLHLRDLCDGIRQIPVVVMTGHSSPNLEDKTIELIRKPYSMDDLTRAVRRHFKSTAC